MSNLSSHPNVYETCLQLLADKGWRIATNLSDQDAPDSWVGLRGDVELWADNPIELLGLVAVWEARWPGQYEAWWWIRGNTGPSLWERARDQAQGEQKARIERLEGLRRDDPVVWGKKIRHAIEEYGDLLNASAMLEIPRTLLRELLQSPELADLRDTPDDPSVIRG